MTNNEIARHYLEMLDIRLDEIRKDYTLLDNSEKAVVIEKLSGGALERIVRGCCSPKQSEPKKYSGELAQIREYMQEKRASIGYTQVELTKRLNDYFSKSGSDIRVNQSWVSRLEVGQLIRQISPEKRDALLSVLGVK